MNWRIVILATYLWFAIHPVAIAKQKQGVNKSFGAIAIGQPIPKSGNFTHSNCDDVKEGPGDCTASDAGGWIYSFYEGKLIRLSLDASVTNLNAVLPAGVVFGEDVALSAKKIGRAYGVVMKRGTTEQSQAVYASEFVVRSVTGWTYSIELIADNKGGLQKIVARANFP